MDNSLKNFVRVFALSGLLGISTLACAGVTTPGENVGQNVGGAIKYQHDDRHNVGCWIYVNQNAAGSISCLPDSEYNAK